MQEKVYRVYRVQFGLVVELYFQVSDASQDLLHKLKDVSDSDIQRVNIHNVVTSGLEFGGTNSLVYKGLVIEYSVMILTNEEIALLPKDEFASLVWNTQTHVKEMIDEHEYYVTQHVDSLNDYKWYMIEDYTSYDIETINERINDILWYHNLVRLHKDITKWLTNHLDHIVTIHWVDGYYKSGYHTTLHTWHMSETETQLQFKVPKCITDKLDYHVYQGDIATVGLNGYFELRLNTAEVWEMLTTYLQ